MEVRKFCGIINFELPKISDLQEDYKKEFNKKLSLVSEPNEIIHRLMQQLNRDFQGSGFDLHLHSEEYKDYETLQQFIHEILMACVPHKVDKLTRLCYRMDLPESTVVQLFSSYETDIALLKLADVMIFRELKKVIFKYQLEKENI